MGSSDEMIVFAVMRPSTGTAPTQHASPAIDLEPIRPSRLLAHDEYFNELFKLLNLPMGMRVWDLIESLPTNENLKENLMNLKV